MTLAAGEDHGARLIVHAGRGRFALAAQSVREVTPLPRLTRVPLAPPALLGLGSIRGETLAVLSLATLAGIDPAGGPAAAAVRQLLVVEGRVRAALAIDRVERLERAGFAQEADGPIVELAVDALLADAMPIRAASRRATGRAIARSSASDAADERLALLRFAVGAQSFALPLDAVSEVMRVPPDIAELPGGDAAVVGSILWRDTTLGILSLAALLGLPAPAATKRGSSRIVVVGIGLQRLGLLVEKVETVIRVAPGRIDPVPATLLRGDREARIMAIFRPSTGGRLVSVLATDALLSEARTHNLLAAAAVRGRGDSGEMTRSSARLPVLPIAVGRERLAFPLAAVRQVAPMPARVTRLPGVPDWLIGVATVGGLPLPIVDQVLRITGVPAAGQGRRLLVVDAGGVRVGFVVSGTERVVHADRDGLAPAPLPENLADGIFGEAIRLSDGAAPLLLIEPAALVSATERALIESLTSPDRAGAA